MLMSCICQIKSDGVIPMYMNKIPRMSQRTIEVQYLSENSWCGDQIMDRHSLAKFLNFWDKNFSKNSDRKPIIFKGVNSGEPATFPQ